MSDKDFPSSIRSQFRQAAKETCQPSEGAKVDAHAPPDLSASSNTTGNTKNSSTKSSAQVALCVKRPSRLT